MEENRVHPTVETLNEGGDHVQMTDIDHTK